MDQVRAGVSRTSRRGSKRSSSTQRTIATFLRYGQARTTGATGPSQAESAPMATAILVGADLGVPLAESDWQALYSRTIFGQSSWVHS